MWVFIVMMYLYDLRVMFAMLSLAGKMKLCTIVVVTKYQKSQYSLSSSFIYYSICMSKSVVTAHNAMMLN